MPKNQSTQIDFKEVDKTIRKAKELIEQNNSLQEIEDLEKELGDMESK